MKHNKQLTQLMNHLLIFNPTRDLKKVADMRSWKFQKPTLNEKRFHKYAEDPA